MKFNKIDEVVEFKIHDVDWTLKIVDSEEIEGVGETNYCRYEIYIDRELSPSHMILAIRHELTHAFRWTYGLISSVEIMNTPSDELEELIANFVEVFAEEVLNLSNDILKILKEEYLK